MIEIPELKPQSLKSHECDFGTSISKYLWNKVINNHAWVERNIPIGFIMYFHGSRTFANGNPITPPNSDIWVLCNGDLISDIDSPLNGQATPDMRNLFLKGSSTIGQLGGQDTINIAHSHSGITGITNDRHVIDTADNGGDANTGAPHYHTINSVWSSSESVIPPYIELQMYMRKK